MSANLVNIDGTPVAADLIDVGSAGAVKAQIVALADAVVDLLNDAPEGTFLIAFTARRKFLALQDFAKAPNLAAAVPEGEERPEPLVWLLPAVDGEEGRGPRASFEGEYHVDCVIYAKVGVGDAAEALCSDLMALRQQIRDYLKGIVLAVTGGPFDTVARLTGIEGDPAYGLHTLLNFNTFVSAQTLKFRILP
jgi:hypothetical protein